MVPLVKAVLSDDSFLPSARPDLGTAVALVLQLWKHSRQHGACYGQRPDFDRDD
jgi:hypothetical protein